MAKTQFISKKRLISVIRRIGDSKGTGLVSILTDNQRAVLLKFSRGMLIHCYSRSRDIAVVLQVLNETDFVKFSFTSVPVENLPELMSIDTFTEILESGDNRGVKSSSTPQQIVVAKSDQTDITREPLKELLVDIASEYIGLVAEIVVDESLDSNADTFAVIDTIADMIPEPERAAAFREAVEIRMKLAADL